MRIEVLERLIDRLFGDGAEALPPPDAADMAEFAAHLAQPDRPPGTPEGDPAEPLAAWLDGGLEDAARDAFEADLARAQGERHDLESAQAFLDTVIAHPLAAPADLVDAAVAALPRLGVRFRQSSWQIFIQWLRGRPWTLSAAGGAVAVAFSVVLVVSANIDSVTTRAVLPHMQPAAKLEARGAGHVPAGQPAAATGAAVAPAGPIVPAMRALVPPAAPEPAKAAPAAPAPEPAADAAQHMLDEYRAQEMDLEGAAQGAVPAMSGGGASQSAQQDPCAPATAADGEIKRAATAKPGATASAHRSADCDRGYADQGVGSWSNADTAPADAAAAPAPVSPVQNDAMKPAEPMDTGPH